MEPRVLNKLHYFPLTFGIGLFIGLIICYLVALSKDHVSVYVPFISETGSLFPESGIFGLFLILGANLGFITITVRYLAVADFSKRTKKKIDRINSLSLFCGTVSSSGMLIVAVFPLSGNVNVHNIGSFMIFFGLMLYGFLQCLLTYWMHPAYNGILLFKVRLAIFIMCLLFSLTNIIIELNRIVSKVNRSKEAHKIPGDEGFAERLTSAICQRLTVMCYIFFMFTYIREFQKIFIEVSMKSSLNHSEEKRNMV